MAILLHAGDATDLAERVLRAHGATPGNARAVAEHLVESDRMGLASHGLMRVVQYVRAIGEGRLIPDAAPDAALEGSRIAIDGHWTFGQVAGLAAVDRVKEGAATGGLALATVRHIGHAGRIGAYTERLARAGLVAIACATGAPRVHRVAPFNGRAGRMATNPIAWAAPTTRGVIAADFATSTMPEGKVRVMRQSGLSVPDDVLCDSDGRMSHDPEDLYREPPGFLLPLGGLHHGHKGYAMALLAEVLATLLAGDEVTDPSRWGNNLAILAIPVDDAFPDRGTHLVDYMHSTPAIDPARPVSVPGEVGQQALLGSPHVMLHEATWRALVASARAASIPIPDRVTDGGASG